MIPTIWHWERQSYGESKNISGFQELERKEGLKYQSSKASWSKSPYSSCGYSLLFSFITNIDVFILFFKKALLYSWLIWAWTHKKNPTRLHYTTFFLSISHYISSVNSTVLFAPFCSLFIAFDSYFYITLFYLEFLVICERVGRISTIWLLPKTEPLCLIEFSRYLR